MLCSLLGAGILFLLCPGPDDLSLWPISLVFRVGVAPIWTKSGVGAGTQEFVLSAYTKMEPHPYLRKLCLACRLEEMNSQVSWSRDAVSVPGSHPLVDLHGC